MPSLTLGHRRGRDAAGRLAAARRSFDRSLAALRTAALNEVDRHDFVSTALRASLLRLAAAPRPPSCDAEAMEPAHASPVAKA